MAEKVAFVQTTIVVTLLHLGREIEFSDCNVSARTKPAPTSLSSLLFLKVVFPSNLLNSRNILELAQTSTFSLFVREWRDTARWGMACSISIRL